MKKYMNDVISFWKKHWGSLVAFIILESIIALFIASFVLDIMQAFTLTFFRRSSVSD